MSEDHVGGRGRLFVMSAIAAVLLGVSVFDLEQSLLWRHLAALRLASFTYLSPLG